MIGSKEQDPIIGSCSLDSFRNKFVKRLEILKSLINVVKEYPYTAAINV